MKRFTIALIALLCTFGLATPAHATSGAHFFSAVPSITSAGALQVAFDEAGVGQQTVNYVLSTTQSATFACINGGGNHPQAANKELITSTVNQAASFEPKNGRVQGTITTSAPTTANFCPLGQTFVLACVTYTNTTLFDTTNGVSTPVADASAVFVSPDLARQLSC